MSDMSWSEVEKALEKTDIVLFPVGSTEQHAPHLPLNNDIFTSFEISNRVAQKLAPEIPILIAPPLPYGVSSHHMSFPGTITLQIATFIEVVKNVVASLATHGFKNIVIVNGHGGNSSPLHVAMQQIADQIDADVFLVDWWDLVPDVTAELFDPPFYHACETETSLALALNQKVDMEKATPFVPAVKSKFVNNDLMGSKSMVYQPIVDLRDITQTGVVGNPNKATKDRGEKLLDEVLNRFASFIKELASK
jgi:creatinine amidohydrolase